MRRNSNACSLAALATTALLVLPLAAGQPLSSVAGCLPSDALASPSVVQDATGAAELARTVNCSGGTFEATWLGSVTVDETILVPADTTLNITGSSDGTSVADGAGQTPLFSLDGGGVLHLSDLTLRNGRAASGSGGGAILAADSAVTLTRCTLSDNAAEFGGAIAMARSELLANVVRFEGNSAGFSGGAIYAAETRATLNDCNFLNNSAEYGGGLFSDVSELRLIDVSFEGNSAQFDGGGIEAREGTRIVLVGLVSFVGNYAGLASSESFGWYGGAGWFAKNSDVVAAGRLEMVGNSAGQGGAAVVADGALSVDGHFLVANNTATGDGVLYAQNSMVTVTGIAVWEGNKVDYNGAGMFLFNSTVSMLNETEFASNSAGERRVDELLDPPEAVTCFSVPEFVQAGLEILTGPLVIKLRDFPRLRALDANARVAEIRQGG